MLQRGWGSRGKECGRTTLTCPQNSQRGLLSALHPHPQALSSWFQGSLEAWKGTELTLEASADPFQRCGRSSLWSGRASLQEGGRAPARVWAELPPRVGAGPGSKWSWRSSPGWQQWERLAPLKQGRGAVPREPGGELRDSQGADQRELRLTGQRCTPKREAGVRRGPNLPPGPP